MTIIIAIMEVVSSLILWVWCITDGFVGYSWIIGVIALSRVERRGSISRRGANLLWRLAKLHDFMLHARDGVARYLTIPYLVVLPGAIVSDLLSSDPTFWRMTNVAVRVYIGWMMWRQFKNRKRKHKIKERVLAKVEDVGHKLVVVPVGAR